MSARAHRPTPGSAVNPTSSKSELHIGTPESGGAAPSTTPTRLQVIHHLVRSGDYHIPATAIADRMIEQLLTPRREYDF